VNTVEFRLRPRAKYLGLLGLRLVQIIGSIVLPITSIAIVGVGRQTEESHCNLLVD
jgi:hypothetical protein